jgi:hypothetical protein
MLLDARSSQNVSQKLTVHFHENSFDSNGRANVSCAIITTKASSNHIWYVTEVNRKFVLHADAS